MLAEFKELLGKLTLLQESRRIVKYTRASPASCVCVRTHQMRSLERLTTTGVCVCVSLCCLMKRSMRC